MFIDIKDKVIIITGSSGGIGKELAIKFAELGAKVVINGRKEEKIQEVYNIIKSRGCEPPLAIQANLRKYENVENLINKTYEQYGKIDVLINNAGGSFSAPAEEISANGWNAVIETNLSSVFYCSKAAFNIMRNQQHGGKIINISSVAAFLPDVHYSPYSAAKGGLNLLTETLAVEWAKYNILVNGIAPGFIDTKASINQGSGDTNEIALRRRGKPEDLFGAALLLVSDLSNYITGETIRVDGGLRGALRNV
ncbi:SDR family NAD(P)-dependent oxidoreductase [Metabacillus arenae]|uniref:SDR family oxidoreductase n=1 Tax=Metabacillus arenae TaxID=2771434 RepID=A0A926NG86_9BACI|nr:SDR family oxidoreductase [Metabacillus arenae]MBD1380994.1 SDR family oxidoreductase [Metabacillus arenae]